MYSSYYTIYISDLTDFWTDFLAKVLKKVESMTYYSDTWVYKLCEFVYIEFNIFYSENIRTLPSLLHINFLFFFV